MIRQKRDDFALVQNDLETVRCRRATTIYLAVMLFVFPLFTGIYGYDYLHAKKFALFACATVIWTSFLVIGSARRVVRGGRISGFSLPAWCILLFALAVMLSTIQAQGEYLFFGGRYDGLVTHLLYVCILAGVFHYGQPEEKWLRVFAAAYTICCATALLQLLGWNALWLYPDGMNYYDPYVQEVGRFLGTVGNIDVLSALHCLALPLLGAAVVEGTKRERFTMLVPIILGTICQIWAGVASGLLAMCITTILFLPPALFRLNSEKKRMLPARIEYFFGPLLLLTGAILLYLIPFRSGTLYEMHSILHGDVNDEFGSRRIQVWKKTWDVFCDHPVLGVGPENLKYYLEIETERYSAALGETLRAKADNAHNEYLQMLASFGVCGFLPAAVLAVLAIVRTIRFYAQDSVIRILAPCLFCYLLQAFFNIGLCIVMPLFCIAAGLLLGHTENARRIESKEHD